MTPQVIELWPGSGRMHLDCRPDGRCLPTPAWWRHWLARPELALVAESCRAETRLHRALQQDPLRPVRAAELDALADTDVRDNYRHWLVLRDGLQAAGSLQGWLVGQFHQGVQLPPLFIDLVLQAIVTGLLDDPAVALQARAAELFFRPQRLSFEQGRVLAADAKTVQQTRQDQGLGELGRLMAQAQVRALAPQLPVLADDNESRYWGEAVQAEFRSSLLLDLTAQLSRDVGHGLQFKLGNARSGLKPLALLLQRWVQQMLGVAVTIEPVPRIDDAHWRWHVGLDADASALLDDLYAGRPVDDQRLARVVGLFRLQFADAAEMRSDVAGVPVYLGLMADAQGRLRLKPQNLLLNLPLATRS
ncbi:MAG: hypothetical protein IPI03_00175 [Rubrivivax sp.]|nr:hypothetical protein [Rubrivivax sp.]MBK8526045.1 hypothetical protein [Rubrivivax sp.]